MNHPQQQAITNSIVKDLVIKCAMPLSIVDNVHFRRFLHVVDPKYTPVARSTITQTKIPKLVDTTTENIKQKLAEAAYVSLTIDIWTDRRMRAYFGCTAHYITYTGSGDPILASSLLCIERFTGSHTGGKIAEFIDDLIDVQYTIRSKVTYVLSDNAANMRKAFRLAFPATDEDDDCDGSDDGDDVDNADIWNELLPDDETQVNTAVNGLCTRRLPCFAHTEQLVVDDGLKQLKSTRSLMGKCSRLSTVLHTSSSFTDTFEESFGTATSVTSENVTRWHSTLRQLQCIIKLDQKKLQEVLTKSGHDNLILSGRENAQLTELVTILAPFLEATEVTQGELDF